jgi:type II secretory pathway component PulF
MLFSRRLPVSALIDFSRSMRQSLSSGIMLKDVMETLASKGTPRVRPVADQLAKDLKSGWGLQDALKRQTGVFPPLFLSLTAVGEESGHLPEVLGEMEKYYRTQQKLRKEFISQITWPIFQLVMAVFVIAGLIYALDIVNKIRNVKGPPMDPLGFGLVGEKGAIIFLLIAFGTALALYLLFQLVKWLFRGRPTVDRFLLNLPFIGGCKTSIALTRFSIALRLMLETNMSVLKMMELALLATDNTAFQAAGERIAVSLKQGNNIETSLAGVGIFPRHYLSAVAVAESSGRLPELLRDQAEELDEETRRRLAVLNQMAGYLVWIGVGALVIFAIFRIFSSVYVENIEKVLPGGG